MFPFGRKKLKTTPDTNDTDPQYVLLEDFKTLESKLESKLDSVEKHLYSVKDQLNKKLNDTLSKIEMPQSKRLPPPKNVTGQALSVREIAQHGQKIIHDFSRYEYITTFGNLHIIDITDLEEFKNNIIDANIFYSSQEYRHQKLFVRFNNRYNDIIDPENTFIEDTSLPNNYFKIVSSNGNIIVNYGRQEYDKFKFFGYGYNKNEGKYYPYITLVEKKKAHGPNAPFDKVMKKMSEQPPFISQRITLGTSDFQKEDEVAFSSFKRQVNITLPNKFKSNIDDIGISEEIKKSGIESGGGAHSVIIISDINDKKYYLICGEGYVNNSFIRKTKGRMQGGPGGAKEADQGYMTTIKKEMIEEIGIDLDNSSFQNPEIRMIKCDVKLSKSHRNDFVTIGTFKLNKAEGNTDSPEIEDFPNRVDTDVHVDYLITFKVNLDFDKITNAEEIINAIFKHYNDTDFEIQYLLLLKYERNSENEESPFDQFCKSNIGDNPFEYKLFIDKEKDIKSINGKGKIEVVDTNTKNNKGETVYDYILHIHGNNSEQLTQQPQYNFLEGKPPIFRDFVKPREFVDDYLHDIKKLTNFTIELKTLDKNGNVISREDKLKTKIKFKERYLTNNEMLRFGGKKSKKVKKFIKTKKRRHTKRRRLTKRRRPTKRRRAGKSSRAR